MIWLTLVAVILSLIGLHADAEVLKVMGVTLSLISCALMFR